MPLYSLIVSAAALGGLSFYLVGLATGAVTLVGFANGNAVSRGLVVESRGLFADFRGPPVYLTAGRALRADYEVDAEVGSLQVMVAQPLFMDRWASAYVAGQRRGHIVFVARTAGWYRFWADPMPIFGRRCHGPDASMVDVLTGRDGCPSYDIRYKVTWHLADGAETGPDHVTVPIRDRGEKSDLVVVGQ